MAIYYSSHEKLTEFAQDGSWEKELILHDPGGL